MKIYLQNIVKELKQYSESLDKQSILVNKPWALVDSDLEIQKLIFKKDNQLIMSKNGQVTTGSWEYLAEAKCLLIDRGTDKILCNENYIDDSILVLKVDGRSDDFFILANENNIPDLDAYSYLFKALAKKANLQLSKLQDDSYLQFKPDYNHSSLTSGSKVLIDFDLAKDGEYISKDETQKFVIKNGEVVSILFLNKHYLENEEYILIETKAKNEVKIGCRVTKYGQHIDHDAFLILESKVRLQIVNSSITSITYPKSYSLRNGYNIQVERKSEYEFKVGDDVYFENEIAANGKYILKGYRSFRVKDGKIIKLGVSKDIKYLLIMFFIVVILVVFAFLIELSVSNQLLK